MFNRCSTLIFTRIIPPVSKVFAVIRNASKAIDREVLQLDETMKKTRLFLNPQIETIENTYENKYWTVTWESVAYTVSVGEEIANRQIYKEEILPFLVGVFGKDYQPRFRLLFSTLEEKHGPKAFDEYKKNFNGLAKDDVKKGGYFSSNFLVMNAHKNENVKKKM